jgi:SAM-dependent methyltransferase
MSVSPFDELAADYERQELENPIRQRMRARSLAVLEANFPAGAKLVDVGCGTGTEALWLAQRGRHVTAVDPSTQMLDVLNARARAANLDIPTHLLRAGALGGLTGEFDGAYSSFGGLNTEPDLGAALASLARLVRPGGRIVLGVMNRWCVSEMALMMAAGRPRQAFRRYRPTLTVQVGTTSVDVQYPSWPGLKRTVNAHFKVLRVEALLLLLLPYAWPRLAAHKSVFGALDRIDRALAPHRPWAWLGDHLLVIAERR